jgi:Fanconi anemia group M protein
VDYVGKEDQKAYVGNLFREFPAMREALDMLKSMAGKGAHHSPKMGKLQHIMRKHFSKNGEFSRVMIFTSFRDSVHDIVRACREMGDETQLDGAAGDDPRRGSVDPIPGQGTITTLFAGATGAGANTVDRKDSKSSSATGNDHRVKVAAFIGQGDTSKGGADGAGAARGTKGQSQKEQKAVLDAFRHGSLNTVVATSIGEEGLDIPAVDLIVFFDVVDIIRTIQRMGRTGRARDGNVVVLATEGKEAQKFKTEYDKYEYMLKSLGDPGRVFDFCNDCPRMLPPGHDPVVEFLKLGPTPEELSKIRAQTLKSAEKAQSGGPGGRSGVGGKKDPFAFQTRAWDAPLTIVETSLLAAYAHPNGASNELDLDRSAPFQRRATPVYNVGHGRLAVALMRGVSAAQGLPPPKDVAGKVIEGGAIARARDAARQKEEETAAAFAEENHPSQHFAPPVEWDGDEWERPAAAEEQNHAWSDEDDAWEPPFEDSREYVAPPYETDSPGEAAGVDRVAPVDLGAMETDPRIADEIAAENFDDDRSARAPTGATQRLDFSTQPATTQGANEPETVRAPLAHIALVSSQLTPRVPVGSKSPTAAESARRRLAERASQQSQQLQRSSEIEVRDDTHDDDDLDDDETVGDMAFHIEQRRLAALAKRRSVSAARSAEKRGGAKSAEKVTPNAKKSCDEHQARVSMPPPPPRASPAVAVSPATTVGGGWGGQDGATPVREDDTSGWGVCSDLSGEKRTRDERDNEGDVSGWGAATHPSPAASCGGSQGWGNTSPVDTEGLAAPDTAGGGWGAPAHTSQDGFGGEWGVEADGDDADADDWGVWGSARRTPKETFQRTTGALPVPGHVAPTPDSEDLRLVKRRKRANSEKVQNDDDDEDETQPSLNPRRRGNRETEPEPAVKERSPSRRAATAASRRLKRTDATKAAVRRFVDDEAAGDDDDADGSGDDGWCTEDDEFIAATQEGDEDGNGDGNGNRFAYQAAANATPGTGTSGGVSRVISKFGPWSRLDVRDTPSPTQAPGHTPIASSQYGGSFIDDEVEDEDDGVGRVLSGGG